VVKRSTFARPIVNPKSSFVNRPHLLNFLTLENVTKSYGEKVLFQNISLHLDKGQKIGLIAKNGTGKSTLMRVIAGKEGSEGENAKITLRKDIHIGWLDQEPNFPPNMDVLGAVLDPSNPLVRVVQRYEKALLHPENPDELTEAIAEMDQQNAWTFEAKVKETLSRFRMDNYEQKVSTLSGANKSDLHWSKSCSKNPIFSFLTSRPTTWMWK
jgi:ATP-binding cassette subfamily F protein uup